MSKTTKKSTRAMYVWYPESLGDYTNGVVCVIAESKIEAINLAVEERYPALRYARTMSRSERAAVDRTNLSTVIDRNAFRDELKRDKPCIIRRGAIIEYGGS